MNEQELNDFILEGKTDEAVRWVENHHNVSFEEASNYVDFIKSKISNDDDRLKHQVDINEEEKPLNENAELDEHVVKQDDVQNAKKRVLNISHLSKKWKILAACIVGLFIIGALIFIFYENSTKKATETVEAFYQAFKSNDTSREQELYPNITKLSGSSYKTTSLTIGEVRKGDNGQIIVNATNKWVNGFGVEMPTEMIFYVVKEKTSGKYIIEDSKNFVPYDEDSMYKFAQNIGCATSKDVTDQQKAARVSDASQLYFELYNRIKTSLENGFRVGRVNWETNDYSWSANGSATVTNNTGCNVSNVKYYLTYSRGGNVITNDDGYVDYGTFYAGETKSFSYYTTDVGNATYLNITVGVDKDKIDETITDIINNSTYSGTEYAEWESSSK